MRYKVSHIDAPMPAKQYRTISGYLRLKTWAIVQAFSYKIPQLPLSYFISSSLYFSLSLSRFFVTPEMSELHFGYSQWNVVAEIKNNCNVKQQQQELQHQPHYCLVCGLWHSSWTNAKFQHCSIYAEKSKKGMRRRRGKATDISVIFSTHMTTTITNSNNNNHNNSGNHRHGNSKRQ